LRCLTNREFNWHEKRQGTSREHIKSVVKIYTFYINNSVQIIPTLLE